MSKNRILIVEDEKYLRISLMVIIERMGYQADYAVNGKDAFRKILANQMNGTAYNLLISDLQMPVMTGEELIQKLIQVNIEMPILVVTGFGDKEFVLGLMQDGIRDFINKPFYPEEIEERVTALLDATCSKKLERIRNSYLTRVNGITRSNIEKEQ